MEDVKGAIQDEVTRVLDEMAACAGIEEGEHPYDEALSRAGGRYRAVLEVLLMECYKEFVDVQG